MDKDGLLSYAKIVEIIGTDLEKIQDAVNSLFIKIIKYLATILQGTDSAVTLDDIGTEMKEKNSAKCQSINGYFWGVRF